MNHSTYMDFLKSKMAIAKDTGVEIDPSEVNPALLPHQRDIVCWALRGGRRAVFAQFGLGKTIIQLEFCKQVIRHNGGKALIICPLGVKQEFAHDAAEILGYDKPEYVKTMAEIKASWADKVWDDINRMRTLNAEQKRRDLQMHVCPLQLDIVERLITRYSNEGDVILDPFGGIGTVPMLAIKMKRYGIVVELNPDYFRDGVGYCQAEEDEIDAPTLFDYLEENVNG